MDTLNEKQLAKEMAEICKKIAGKQSKTQKPWQKIILNVVIGALAGGSSTIDGGWGGIPKN